MCQLSFINCNNEKINKIFFRSFSFINTIKDHKDGFGIYSNGKIIKEKESPWNYVDFVPIYEEIINENPLILHVRKTSPVNAFLLNKEENFSHPFESKDLILAHNGTLEKKLPDSIVDKIDSQIYLEELQKEYEKIKNLPEALVKSMEDFYGKFAFLLYEKEKKSFYAVRGKSALLYYYPIFIKNKYIGYIINTERDSLEKSIVMAANFLAAEGIKIKIDNEKLVLLEKESIFSLEERDIKTIGKIKEKEPITYRTFQTKKWAGHTKDYYWDEDENDCNINIVINFMGKFLFSLEEIDILFSKLFQKSILGASTEDLDTFSNILILMEDEIDGKKIGIREGYKNYFMPLYQRIEFPYFFEEEEKLRKLCQN